MAASVNQANHGLALSPDPGSLLSFRRNELTFYVIVLFVFVVAAAATLYFNRSMSGGMPMSGGWTMSMMWVPMGEALDSAGIFSVMWLAMMVAMMLPSAMPMLLLYRRVIAFRATQNDTGMGKNAVVKLYRKASTSTSAVAAGYFFIWTLFGLVTYAIGSLIARGAMHWEALSRALPLAGGIALCVAGMYQITAWKRACLTHCRDPLTLVSQHLHGNEFGGLRLGIHHGTFCVACCWGLMLMQLVLGVMNLGVMIAVALVIALEKVLPRGEWVARSSGAAAILGGVFIAVKAI